MILELTINDNIKYSNPLAFPGHLPTLPLPVPSLLLEFLHRVVGALIPSSCRPI